MDRTTRIETIEVGGTTITQKLVFDPITMEMIEEHVTTGTYKRPNFAIVTNEMDLPERAK
jgi:hypothetical protein